VIARVATVTLHIRDIELALDVLLRFYIRNDILETVVQEASVTAKRPHLLLFRVAGNARRDNTFSASVLHRG
jgi:hypothetical protein